MMDHYPANARGQASFGWLDSQHTFSFGHWYNPKRMGVSALRVINEDKVKPRTGFGTHPHQDMEILSYVLSGELAHKDSLGNGSRIPAGDFQLMRAGTGITHSEMNPSADTPVHFLQIWIRPDTRGLTPGYQQKAFADQTKTLVLSPDGRDGSMQVAQDVLVYRVRLAAGETLEHIAHGRTLFLHQVSGTTVAGNQPLAVGDGVAVSDEAGITLHAEADSELLLFDLP